MRFPDVNHLTNFLSLRHEVFLDYGLTHRKYNELSVVVLFRHDSCWNDSNVLIRGSAIFYEKRVAPLQKDWGSAIGLVKR